MTPQWMKKVATPYEYLAYLGNGCDSEDLYQLWAMISVHDKRCSSNLSNHGGGSEGRSLHTLEPALVSTQGASRRAFEEWPSQAFPALTGAVGKLISISHCFQSTTSSGLSQEFHWNVNNLQIPGRSQRISWAVQNCTCWIPRIWSFLKMNFFFFASLGVTFFVISEYISDIS